MTLIVGLRCAQGVVICADSQETVGQYRVAVQKIIPRDVGNFSIVAGGSGSGEVIDGCIAKLEASIAISPIETLAELKELIESELKSFLPWAATVYPKKDVRMKMIIGARSKRTSEIVLWATKTSQVTVPYKDHALIGWEDALYEHVLERQPISLLNLNEAALLGVRLFQLAKSTSNYIGGPTSIVIIRTNGVLLADESQIIEYEERIAKLGVLMDGLLLTSADMDSPNLFDEKFEEFRNAVLQIRADFDRISIGAKSK